MAESDLTLLARKFSGLPERLERNLTQALSMASMSAADFAKTNHEYVDRSNALTGSIEPDGPFGSFKNNDLHAILSAGAAHASYIEKGTRPHVIKARRKKALRWPVAAGFAFAKSVKHPGTRPYRFLQNAVDHVEPILADKLVPQAVELAFVQIGFARG